MDRHISITTRGFVGFSVEDLFNEEQFSSFPEIYLESEIYFILESKKKLTNVKKNNLKFKILYIGKSSKGNNTAIKRLKKHEKLTEILLKKNKENIYILCYKVSFNPALIAGFGVNSKELQPEEDAGKIHTETKKTLDNIGNDTLVSLFEACCIAYFKPEFNKTYKKDNPFEHSLLLKEFYTLGIRSFSAELGNICYNNTKQTPPFIMFTDTRETSDFPIAEISLAKDGSLFLGGE